MLRYVGRMKIAIIGGLAGNRYSNQTRDDLEILNVGCFATIARQERWGSEGRQRRKRKVRIGREVDILSCLLGLGMQATIGKYDLDSTASHPAYDTGEPRWHVRDARIFV